MGRHLSEEPRPSTSHSDHQGLRPCQQEDPSGFAGANLAYQMWMALWLLLVLLRLGQQRSFMPQVFKLRALHVSQKLAKVRQLMMTN